MAIDPGQFRQNEAWLLFQLNDEPIHTMKDGNFNAYAIMEVTSGMIFGMEMIPDTDKEISEFQSRKLIAGAEAQAGKRPERIFIEDIREEAAFVSMVATMGIKAEMVTTVDIDPLIKEAREGFAAHISGRRMQ